MGGSTVGLQERHVNGDFAVKTDPTDDLTTFSADYGSGQTDLEIITPTSGKALNIKHVYVSTSTTNVDVSLIGGTGSSVYFKLYTAQKGSQSGIPCKHLLAVDEKLELTCGANTFLCVSYREE